MPRRGDAVVTADEALVLGLVVGVSQTEGTDHAALSPTALGSFEIVEIGGGFGGLLTRLRRIPAAEGSSTVSGMEHTRASSP